MSTFNVKIYISKIKTFIIHEFHELYFGFFQTFEDSIFEGFEETEI